jgi:acyl carrier protein
MTQQELRAQLAEMIEQSLALPREAVLADTPFFELGCDSLDVLEIGFFLEREFGVDLEGKVNARNLPRHLSDVVKVLLANLPPEALDAMPFGQAPNVTGQAPKAAP